MSGPHCENIRGGPSLGQPEYDPPVLMNSNSNFLGYKQEKDVTKSTKHRETVIEKPPVSKESPEVIKSTTENFEFDHTLTEIIENKKRVMSSDSDFFGLQTEGRH